MTRPLAVLRPEPGNARTAAAIEALGYRAIRLPLFAVAPVAWNVPDPATLDGLVVTSANALRHGGAGLARLAALPVHVVGEATAKAARDAGFAVASVGTRDAAALVAAIPPCARLLHLAGRERAAVPGLAAITVYAADPLPIEPLTLDVLAESVALLHSTRAATRLAALLAPDRRARVRLAALSPAVLQGAGDGWSATAAAPVPTDAALLAAARQLAD